MTDIYPPTGSAYAGMVAEWRVADREGSELVGQVHHAAQLLAAMATGFVAIDRGWRITYVNRAGERILRIAADDVIGLLLWDALPGSGDLEFGRQYRRAVDTGEPVELEAYYPHLDAWFDVRAVPSDDGLALYLIDITARHVAQAAAESARRRAEALQAQAELAAARLALLAAVSSELSETLDAETAVGRLAQLVVPTLADWSIVTLIDDDGTMRDVGWWHAAPDMRAVVERLANTRFENRDWQGPVQEARDLGTPVIIRQGVTERAAELLGSEEALAAMRELAPESSVALPLTARGRVIGVLSLCRDARRPPMSDEAMSAAAQIADRAAVALDNARLYVQQRTLAEALQRSLLTEPPEPDALELSVRYVPAATGAAVGGDWYDSFVEPDGATMLVIGDVIGHDTEAAAAMGQLRGLLRGIAWSSGDSPAAILASLDAGIAGLGLRTIATATVARLEQTDGRGHVGKRNFRWSNAGHPPPLLLHPDGAVSTLDAQHPELLLGIDPAASRSDGVVTLLPGSTVLLYTDGLIERHDEDLDAGVARLARTFGELADLPLDALCDGLLTRMLPRHADDDVAILAVRVHREDEPRPGDAGPVAP